VGSGYFWRRHTEERPGGTRIKYRGERGTSAERFDQPIVECLQKMFERSGSGVAQVTNVISNPEPIGRDEHW